jgi:hypothetical protein
MKVESIRWLSREAQEAEVEVSAGGVTCWAFSQPCTVSVGEELDEPLHVFDATGIRTTEQPTLGVWPIVKGRLGRKVVAIYADSSRRLFLVGDLLLIVSDYLPGDLQIGSTVEFECARIDLW